MTIIIISAVLALLLLLVDSNLRIVYSEHEIEFDNLPENFDGFRIVQLSDLHEKVFGKGNKYLISRVSEANPDLIAITGDMVDRAGENEYVYDLVSELAGIAPVYYVSGNHEWASKVARETFTVVTDAGGTVLRNRYVTLERDGERIVIAGIDDPAGPYDMKTPAELSSEIESNEGDVFSVLLAHRNNPNTYSGLCNDVILCGHAHGGVIRLPFIGGLLGTNRKLFPKYTEGVYDLGGNYMVVSRGLGSGIIIPRFLNNPDISILILKSA